MISTAIYGAATYLALVGVLNLLPDYEEMPLPEGFLDAFTTMMGYMIAWDEVLPISTLITCATIILIAQMSIFTWKGGVWLLKTVRGTSA